MIFLSGAKCFLTFLDGGREKDGGQGVHQKSSFSLGFSPARACLAFFCLFCNYLIFCVAAKYVCFFSSHQDFLSSRAVPKFYVTFCFVCILFVSFLRDLDIQQYVSCSNHPPGLRLKQKRRVSSYKKIAKLKGNAGSHHTNLKRRRKRISRMETLRVVFHSLQWIHAETLVHAGCVRQNGG